MNLQSGAYLDELASVAASLAAPPPSGDMLDEMEFADVDLRKLQIALSQERLAAVRQERELNALLARRSGWRLDWMLVMVTVLISLVVFQGEAGASVGSAATIVSLVGLAFRSIRAFQPT